MTHPALSEGRTAVITGAAMGIGLAVSKRLANIGMKVCMVDIDSSELDSAAVAVTDLAKHKGSVLPLVTDVADRDAMDHIRDRVVATLGDVAFLMNNAVSRAGGGAWGDESDWHQAMDVNFWGVTNGVRAFVPVMVKSGRPGIVINTGSKQGITNPPGNTAYNVTKAALKAYTEGLQHDLRNTEGCAVSAHLLIPGWTTTGKREHKPGAWLPDQVVDYMMEALQRGDFYILCPDGEVTVEMDRKRILWSAGDITENRPPLSRWHTDYGDEFAAFEP